MSQHLSLDASTFEGLLAAVWVLQRHHEQAAGSQTLAPDAMAAAPPETRADPPGISERDTVNARLVLSVLSKAANGSQVSRHVRCASCDHESASQSQFCGMCGARVGEAQLIQETEPPVELKAPPEAVTPPGGSFLPSLPAEPESNFVYRFEDDASSFRWGRVLVLIVLLGCVAAAVSYSYRDLRNVAAKLFRRESAPAVSVVKPTSVRPTLVRPTSVRPATGIITPSNRTPADQKMASLGDDVRQKPLPKPSAGVPLDTRPRAARHRVLRASSVRRKVTGRRKFARNHHLHSSPTVRASAAAPAPASAIHAPRRESLHDSENQTARDAQNKMDQSQATSSDDNMQGLGDDRGNEPAVATRHYVPRPPPGFGTSNITARGRHRVPRPPREGVAAPNEPEADEFRTNDRQIPMNRVPRPPQR